MRYLSVPKIAALSVLAGAMTLIGVARPAAAQDLPDPKKSDVVAVRGGVYFPFNSRAKSTVGKTWYGGGLDYAIQQTPGVSRTNVSLDYIERSSGGNVIRIIPLTISQVTLQNPGGTVHPYLGFGAGVYFIHQNVPNSIGFQENRNSTALGGFVSAGVDLPGNILIEGRYHLISKVGSVNSSGLQLMAGFRF